MDRLLSDSRSPMEWMNPSFSLEVSPTLSPNLDIGDQAPLKKEGDSCSEVSALDVIKSEPELSSLHLAIVYNSMEQLFNDPSIQMTLFAPNNGAFKELSRRQTAGDLPIGNSVVNVMKDKEVMSTILGYHVIVQSKMDYDQLKGATNKVLDTFGGEAQIGLIMWEDIVLLKGVGNNAAIMDMDVGSSCNVAVHIIDSVLLPFELNGIQDPPLSANNSGLQRSAASSVSPPLPVVKSELPLTAINASPSTMEDVPTWARPPVCTPLLSVISQQAELALYHQSFIDHQLAEVLRDQTNITIFAPTDSAMGEFLNFLDTTDSGRSLDTQTMTTLLSYHITYGNWHLSTLQHGMEIQTFATNSKGEPLTLTVEMTEGSDGPIHLVGPLNSVRILQGNRMACGSILHVIDGLLLPPVLEGIDLRSGLS
eukprot:TRINITY_DN465_c2_g1_i2.p1 TRINITY_DN465_c2_g1~~TRINITY_DN465_c2_g1_i2.p1  ORF type:complete len:423 (-),score=56.04 TRINITY_DN465_c2_g1_i2:1070-2338(-)